jgi:hypothetical protein
MVFLVAGHLIATHRRSGAYPNCHKRDLYVGYIRSAARIATADARL